MNSASDRAGAALVALLSLVFIVLRWTKMGSLMWLDPAHWLNEVSRLARGEVPYRDFSFQYPPFAIYLHGWLLRWFGITFTNEQIITDITGVLIVALSYLVIRRLLPRPLQLATACLLVAVCSTSLMNFNLFSFVTYGPPLQTGAAGTLMAAIALWRYVEEGSLGASGWALLAAGGFIAVFSKPEYALTCVCAVIVAALARWEPRMNAAIAAVTLLPAGAAYVAVGMAAGFSNLRAGVSGYGLATATCPWWPTGVGVFGVLAALGEAGMMAALLSLPQWKRFRDRYGARYYKLIGGGAAGALFYFAYIAYQNRDALSERLPLVEKARRILPSMVYSSPVLQPVVWVSIVVFLILLWRLVVWRVAARGEAKPPDAGLLLFTMFPAVMSSRALFGTTQSIYPEVAAVCYPFLLILGPYFLWRFLSSAATPRYAAGVVLLFTLGYGAARVIGGWPEMLSDRRYGRLDTAAGSVKLLGYDLDAQVYRYMMEHTSASDYVLDLPYGGGLNFAGDRRSPIFSTMLYGMAYPREFQDRDVVMIEEHPPALVIALDDATLGTYYGYGQRGDRGCVCPRLVWTSDRPTWDPNYVYPVVTWIEAHYRAATKLGDRVLMVPR